jgi:hypothetical protein
MCLLAYLSAGGGLRLRTMPMNGDINASFGVYRSLCCDAEIVISTGAVFPDCPNHPKLSTVWRSVVEEDVRHISEIMEANKKRKDAA